MTSTEQAGEVIRWCRRLAKLSEDPNAITRTFLSRPMRDVHTSLAAWMAKLGMSVRVDAAGNLRGVYPPRTAQTPASAVPRFYIGSHLDTVPNGGAFDGVLGTVLAIALVELLGARRFVFAIEVIGFSEEEGVRFGAPFLGSRALAGTFDSTLLDRTDEHGRSVREAIRHFGLDPRPDSGRGGARRRARLPGISHRAGSRSREPQLPLAVVDVISGQSRAELTFDGVAGHAGTTPMHMRKDALQGAAAWIAEVERLALATPGLVATVGKISVAPGAGNVVPGRATASIDVRHADDRIRTESAARLAKAADEIASQRGLKMTWEPRLDQASIAMDDSMVAMLERALERTGAPRYRMSSGAGHDAMVLAAKMPAGMVFLRCEGGISHHPAENVRDGDVAAALDAGVEFLNELERSHA